MGNITLDLAKTTKNPFGIGQYQVTLSGSPTLDDWFDQAVKAASSPTFAAVKLTTGAGLAKVLTSAADGTATWETPASSMVYPGTGVPVSTGSAWGTSVSNDTSNTRKFLRELSVGGVFATPAWDTLQAADIPDVSATYVPKSLYDAQTILHATSNDTPVALTVTEQTLVGRITSGNIAALSAAQVKTLLGLGTADSPTFAAIKLTTGAGVGKVLASDDDGDATWKTPSGNPNAIINGGMDIWQRGTATLANPATSTYFPDRFRCNHVLGDGTYNLIQSAETPAAGFPFQFSIQFACTHIETAVGAAEYSGLLYAMEGSDFLRFVGEVATLSFWVKAVKTGIYCVSIRNGGVDRSYIHEYTVNSASTWEKKTVTLTFNGGGTNVYTTGVGLVITWVIMEGSDKQIATANKNTWQTGNYRATDAQVNGFDNTANNFWLTGVQLELGSVATPFEQRPFARELALCQRYYYKTKSAYHGFSGVKKDIGSYPRWITVGVTFPVEMRASPTITIWAGSGTGYLSVYGRYDEGAGTAVADHISNGGFGAVGITNADLNDYLYEGGYTASAEL